MIVFLSARVLKDTNKWNRVIRF